MPETETRVVIFTCNWNAHESLNDAGSRHLSYPPGVRLFKVDCLGQLGASAVLKAFEKGANGVMLVGCLPEECHFESGSRRAKELFKETRRLAKLLGIGEEQLTLHLVSAGEGGTLTEKVCLFVEGVSARNGVGR